MVPRPQTVINKYHFWFKEPGFLVDIRLVDFRYKAGNVQNNPQISYTIKDYRSQEEEEKKANLRRLPLAKNGIIWTLKIITKEVVEKYKIY